MTETPPRNEAAMADILASIRRIVAEEDRQSRNVGTDYATGEVFVLTPDMRAENDPDTAGAVLVDVVEEAMTPSIDEAAIADIARTVVREELNGALGLAMTRNIKKLIREEVARTLAERG
jgi:cell pole-organizing protein PopZ